MNTIEKGQSAALKHTQQGRQRVTVGISWDTPEVMPTRPEAFIAETDDSGMMDYSQDIEVEIGFVQETYDLDLVCLMFDEQGEIVDAVSPVPEESMDLSGAVYHTGDDTRGVSAGDDEQISVELAMLPDNIHSLAFLGIIQSGHLYGQVLNAAVRVADGKTNEDLWSHPLGEQGSDGADKTACAMVALIRGGETGWMLKHILEYRSDKEVEDWAAEVAPFLKNNHN